MYCHRVDTCPEFKNDKWILKYDLRGLSDYAKQKAKDELRETPENIENGLRQLKELLKSDNELNVPIDDDAWLLLWLRPCKYYPESAIEKIKNFYKHRIDFPEMANVKLDTLKLVFENSLASILPQRDQLGRRIILSVMGKTWDHRIISPIDSLKAACMLLVSSSMEPETQIHGAVCILDMDGMSFGQVLTLSVQFIRTCIDFFIRGIAVRHKGFHFVNEPKAFRAFFTCAKPFLNEKLETRMYFHGNNLESLHRHFSPECLPKCFGGKLDMQPNFGRCSYELLSYFEQEIDQCNAYGFRKQ